MVKHHMVRITVFFRTNRKQMSEKCSSISDSLKVLACRHRCRQAPGRCPVPGCARLGHSALILHASGPVGLRTPFAMEAVRCWVCVVGLLFPLPYHGVLAVKVCAQCLR